MITKKTIPLETTITFETKCYENDWEYILKGSYLKKMIDRCGIQFTVRQLIINNIKNRELVESYAKRKVAEGVIDVYYFTEDTEEEVLNFFKLTKESLGKGFVYSISEFTGIYKCKTDFLLHFSSDAYLTQKAKKSTWILEAIEQMKNNNTFIVATPCWNHLYLSAKAESYGTTGNFYLAQGFSDQCYLIPVKIFQQKIYNEKHPYSERYPQYGGELFEKRVDSFLRTHDYYRLIYKKASYIHANFPKTKAKKKAYMFVTKKLGNEFTTLFRTPSCLHRFYDIIISVVKTLFHRYTNMTHKEFN